MKRTITRWAAFLLPILILLAALLTSMFNRRLPENDAAPLSTLDPFQERLSSHIDEGYIFPALYQIENLAAREGWNSSLYRQAGDLWSAAGNLRRALPYWEAAVQIDPEAALLRQLAQSYLSLQRWTLAGSALEQLLKLDPTESWAHYHLGMILAPVDARRAVSHLSQAVDDPAYANEAAQMLVEISASAQSDLPAMQIGLALAELELWAYAERAFAHTTELAPGFAEALAYQGLARDKQGHDGSAPIQQAVNLAPHNAQVRYLEALHLRAEGHYEDSFQAMSRAVALEPDNAAFYVELSTAYRLIGDLNQAEGWLHYAVALSGDAPEFRRLLAFFYADEAPQLGINPLTIFDEAGEALPENDPEVMSSYGWALHRTGDTAAGLEQIETALILDPDNPRALYDKARILLELDRPGEAIPLLEQAAAADSPFAALAAALLSSLRGGG